MLVPGILALVIGTGMLVFRRFAVWSVMDTPMSRMSAARPSRRAYEILFSVAGTIAVAVGISLVLATFLG